MISVLIPVLDGGIELERCLEGLAIQKLDESVEVVIVDSGSSDGSVDIARTWGARVHEIGRQEFGHGRTRNLLASLARGEMLVFTSQDAVAAHPTWLADLTAAARSSASVAGAYGRQLPHPAARPPERFFLDFLYGSEPRLQRLIPGEELTYQVTLFSNVNSAIPRERWDAMPFRDDLLMSEDQEWSRRALLRGWSVVYEPSAAVRHSHQYSMRTAFRRFFDSGVSAEHTYVDGAASRTAIRRAGVRYALEELAWLHRGRMHLWIPYALAYESAKFAGLQVGLRHRHLPTAVKRLLSGNREYWRAPTNR